MRNKKAMILVFVLGLFFTFVLMPFLVVRLEYKKIQFERKIGEVQGSVLDKYQEADLAMFYIDESGRYSLNQALFDLGLNGGFETGCSSYQGYNLWVDNGVNCYPNPSSKVISYFEEYFNEYLNAYPDESNDTIVGGLITGAVTAESIVQVIRLPESLNYDFYVEPSSQVSIVGISAKNLEYSEKGKSFSYEYSVKPSFKASADYSFSEYNVIGNAVSEVIALVDSCKASKDINYCVAYAKESTPKDILGNAGLFFVDVSRCGGDVIDSPTEKVYGFCVESSKKVIAYDSSLDKTGFYPVRVKFGIRFE